MNPDCNQCRSMNLGTDLGYLDRESFPNIDYKTTRKTYSKPPSKNYHETHAQMDPESYDQKNPETYDQIHPETYDQILPETYDQILPETYDQIDTEACAQIDLEAGARMLAEVCAQMNPESCTQINPEGCAPMDREFSDQKDFEDCAQKDFETCAQKDFEACAQTDHSQEVTFGKGYTWSRDIERDIERTHPSVINRIEASRHRIFNNLRVPVEHDLSCPAYAFSADLVCYIMRCYHGSNNRNAFEFTGEFGHASSITYFNAQSAAVLRIVLDDRQTLMHETYAECFRYSSGNDDKWQVLRCRMEVLRIAVEIGHIRSTIDLLNLCIFLAQFCAIAYSYGIHSAPSMALDIIYWNMVQFIRIILGCDSKYFWQVMPDTWRALASEVLAKERKLFHILCKVIRDPAKMQQDS